MRQPPPLHTLQRSPVTVTVGLAALFTTLAWWGNANVDGLFMDLRAWEGQLWRLVTSAFPHLDVLHLAFNLYWLWVFGTLLEEVFGWWKTAGLIVLFASGSAAAEHAFARGGVGLSGVGYGLFGLLWVLSRKDERFDGAVDDRTVWLFTGWFVLCCALTALNVWHVANVAHAAGAVLGILTGLALVAGERRRLMLGCLMATYSLILIAASIGRPYVNLTGQHVADLFNQGTEDLEAGRNERAAQRLEKALSFNPKHLGSWHNLGIARQRLGQTEGAVAAFQRARELSPNNATYPRTLASLKSFLARAKLREEQADAAVALLEEAVALDDQVASYWSDLANAYQRLNRIDDASRALERAAALKPAPADSP
jgi:GlpG protein